MMMLYAKSTGGFYSRAYNKFVPDDAVEISDADYAALLAGQDGGKIITADSDGKPILADQPAPDLATVRAVLTGRIDDAAEAERANYITPGAGQAMAYMAKAQQATAFLADDDPLDADYPLLVAEVGITGDTIADVATAINTAYQSWLVVGARIEAIRLKAKIDIAAAETVEAAQAIFDAVAWPDEES